MIKRKPGIDMMTIRTGDTLVLRNGEEIPVKDYGNTTNGDVWVKCAYWAPFCPFGICLDGTNTGPAGDSIDVVEIIRHDQT
jgi:hypothetical protein